MSERGCDVLVVGAGPTGLSLASELLRHGVSCRIIDALDAPVVWSKAAVVHARTMEIFDDMGVAGPMLERSRMLHGANVYSEGKRIVHVTFEGLDSPFPHVYGISQRETEAVLTAHLAGRGCAVERSRTLVSFEERGGRVVAKVARAGGASEEISAGYIVGCDGAHSAVRKQLGLSFEGSSYEERIIQADVRVDWPQKLDDDEIIAFLHPDGPLAVFPLFQDGRYRLIAFLLAGSPEVEPTLENFQRLLDQRGFGGVVRDPAWMVAFRIHCRKVARYRVGRALLAGDAAHIHSPAGGQGMNTGIQDAYNLAWKLALVIRRAGRGELLDSYEAEREPVARQLLSATDGATQGVGKISGLRHPLAVGLRNQLMSLVTSTGTFQSRVLQSVSMLQIHYPGSPIVRQDRTPVWRSTMGSSMPSERPSLPDWAAFGDGPAPGDRAPDAPLEPPVGGKARLYDCLRGTRHVLFLFDGAAATEEGYRNLERIGREVEERHQGLIDVHLVVPQGERPAALRWGGSTLLDASGEVHRRYGARSECLYLVRPDGHVAYRNQPADGAKLEAYLWTILGDARDVTLPG